MNQKVAKRLRGAARALNLPEETTYAPSGALRHRLTLDGNAVPIMRPLAMKACLRKAEKEAKRLYLGKVEAGEAYSEPEALRPKERPFKHLVVDSINKQPDAPAADGAWVHTEEQSRVTI
jgi:hypothetical protein